MRLPRALAFLVLVAGAAPASAYEGIGAIWPDGQAKIAVGQVGYWWQANLRRACDEWEDKTSFNFIVTTDDHPACSENLQDLRGGVEFSDWMCGGELFSPGVLAVMQSFTSDAGEFIEAGITFNSQLSWQVYKGPLKPLEYDPQTRTYEGEMDFYRVALHELGHYLGLGHAGEGAIMAPIVGDIWRVQQDDIDGVEALYGGGGTGGGAMPVRLSPEVRCRVDQLRAAARLCKRDLRCEAKRARDPARDPGGARRVACGAEARGDFASEWDAAIAKASARGASCADQTPGSGVEPSITAATLEGAAAVGAASGDEPADRALRAKLLTGLAGLCTADLRAWRAEAVDPERVEVEARLEEAEAAFTAGADEAIARAAAKGAAYDGAPPADLTPRFEALANALGASTAP